jgi:hypothetical protein
MGFESNIGWTHHTFNPWIGCTKISPACDRCYAAEYAARYMPKVTWGEPGQRGNAPDALWALKQFPLSRGPLPPGQQQIQVAPAIHEEPRLL